MMPFNDQENVSILKELGRTDVETAERTGTGERTIRNIKNETRNRPRACTHAIDGFVRECVEFPWAVAAHLQVRDVMELIRASNFGTLRRRYGFSASSSAALATSCADDAHSCERWSHALFAYWFYFGMSLSRDGIDATYRDPEPLDGLADVLLDLLGGRSEPWAFVLRFKVIGNREMRAWNESDRRASVTMRSRIDAVGYLDSALEYNDVVPKYPVVPMNALAVASRFEDRERYEPLLERIRQIDSRFPDRTPWPGGFDSNDQDFVDFRCWHASRWGLVS